MMRKIVLMFFFLALGLMPLLHAQGISIKLYQGDTTPCSGTSIRLCAEGLMMGGSDKCVWEWSDNKGAVSIVNIDRTKKNDSVQLALYGGAVSGTLTLTYGANPPIEKHIVVAQAVSTIEKIHADSIFCQNNAHKFFIEPDPRNSPTALDYYGKPVKYTWKFYNSEGVLQYKSEGSNPEAELGVTSLFSHGKVTLIKETCPSTVEHTVKEVLTPFIPNPPISPTASIRKIGFHKSLTTDSYFWVSESSLAACTYYSSAFNIASAGNAVGKWGDGVGRGYGDGYLYLQIGDIGIKGLVYTWTFDPTQFAIAEPSVYNHPDLRNNDFGVDRYRICLKVLNPGPATDESLNISVIANCPACNEMSGTLDYTTKRYEIDVQRQDSLKPYKEFKVIADPTNMPPCSGTEVSFKVEDKDSRPMNILTSNYGITTFRYMPGTGGTQSTVPPTTGYDVNFVIKVRTPGVNDTFPLTVYPANACFRNKVDSTKQVFKVPVITTPKLPLFFDGEGTRITNTTYTQQTGQWTSQYPYLVCNGTLSDLLPEQCLVKSSTQTDLIKEGVGFYRPSFMETAEINQRMVDSLTWEVNIKLDASKAPQTNSYDKLGIYAINKCGGGDTAYFWVHVIDTISTYAPILNDLNGSELPDTICEGTLLQLTSSQQDYTNPVDRYKPLTNPANNPKPKNEWALPQAWSYQTGSDSSVLPVKIVVGEGTGPVRLRYRNKCGTSTYAETQIIEPRRFTRLSIASDPSPCQGDAIVYTINSVRDADRYIWQFPSDWISLNGTNIDTSFNHEAILDTVKDAWTGDIISITGTLSMPVTAGGKAGHIYVIGENDICDFTFANPPRKDSLKVTPKAWTKKPNLISGFFDTLCARDTAHFEMSAHADDTAKAIYYTWHFSNPDWEVYQQSSDSAKKFSVLIPDVTDQKDSILIVGHHHDCDQTNKGDTLVYRFYIKDTVSTIGSIRNHDASVLNTSPCEGDTVFYVVDKSLMDGSVRSIHWAWSAELASDTIKETVISSIGRDSIVLKTIKIGTNAWERLKPNDYGDTLVLRVGRDTLAIYASAVNCCGMSESIMDSIRPVNLIVEIPTIKDPDIICTQEELIYSLQSEIEHATNYTWHFPWNETIDSLCPASGLPMVFPGKAAYDTGYVKVTPYNSCGSGPSDSVHISLINYPPSRPHPANFASTFNPEIDILAIFDTVCLRQENILRLKRNLNKDSVPLEYSWEILFDIDNSMEFQTGDGDLDLSDSTYRITKNAGLDTSLLLFSARVKGCQTYGDSLFVQVRGRDTTALPLNKHSLDYIKDALTSNRLVELLPCASEESFAKYYFDTRIDKTIKSYKFRFGKTLAGIDTISPTTIAPGGTFNNTDWKIVDQNLLQDSLHVKVGTNSIYLQIETNNICGTSKLPALHIKTIGVAPQKINFIEIDSSICYKEITDTFSLNYDKNISSYIWHSPWRALDFNGVEPLPGEIYIDTTYTHIRRFEVDSVLGEIYVQPRNGCINAHPNPSILFSDTIKIEHIIRPPKRVHPLNFAFDYDPSGNLPAIDTLCLRSYPEYIVSRHLEDTLPLEYKWEMVKQSYTTTIDPLDSTCHIKKTEGADTTFLMVSARISVCETYGDSLQIELRTMDTVAMPLPLDEYVFDKKTGNTKIDLMPCGFQEVAYYIDGNFHWSIDSTRFYWNGGSGINKTDSTLGGTDWKILDTLLLPDTLHALTGNFDKLLLQPQVHNLCGWSQPTAIEISPLSLIKLKPKIYIDSILCNRDTIEVSVDSVPYATDYIWHLPWKPKAYTGPTLQEGESYADTVSSHHRKFTEVYETGKVWVTPINKCSQGENSDTVDIRNIIYPPHPLVPNSAWLNTATYIGDTVFDTICRYAVPDYMLSVSPNESDNRDSLIYHWSVLVGSLKIMPDNDTIITVKNVNFVPELNHLVVATRWNTCKTYSDSLHIKLYVMDTVSRGDMGEILPINPAVNFNFAPCPGAEMTIGLENPLASPAYKWSFTDTSWHFKEGFDSTAATITIIAGRTPTMISVTPITDANRSICSYFSNNPSTILTSFIPVPPLTTDTWREQANMLPCAGNYETYKVSPTNNADSYRWEFPSGWMIEGTQDSVLAEGTDTCRVLVGRTAGLISVYAVDTCDPNIPLTILGIPTTLAISPVDSARILFIGDRQPCIDSISIYLVQKNLSTEKFDFEFIPEPADVVHADVYEWISDTELQVRWDQIKAATFIFKPTPNALGFCNNFVNDTIYIKADTVPFISGQIRGDDFICMNDVYEYEAHADMDTAGGQFTVSYTWVLPNDTWKFLSNPDSSWVRVVSGIYMDNSIDTVKCYPRAGCGTGNPFIFPVKLNIPDTLQNSILVDNNDTNPCVGTQIALRLTHNDYKFDTISFYWFAPSSWEELNPDSARTSTTFKVGAQSDTVWLRALRKNSCGLSTPLGIYIHAKEKPKKAEFTKVPYPCIKQEKVGFSIKSDFNTDSLLWVFPDAIEYRLFANRIKYDSVLISEVGEVPISLLLTGFNKCGSTDTVVEIRPVTAIQKFKSDIRLPYAVCVNDTSYAEIEIPLDHLEKGTEYKWFTPLGWTYLFDSVVISSRNPDTICSRVWFKTNDTYGNKISVYARNACGEIPEKERTVDLYRINVTAAAEPAIAPFLQSGVLLEVKEITPPDISYYNYEWSPRNRVSKIEDDLGNSFWETGELVNPVEYFVVKAIDKVTGFKCVGYDTVAVNVVGSFDVDFETRPFICRSDSVYLYANPQGGDTMRYSFRWSSKTREEDVYQDFEGELAFRENPIIYPLTDTIYFRLIACDTIEVDNTELDPNTGLASKLQFILCDTQYLRIEVKDLNVLITDPYNDKIEINVGDSRSFEALISEGTGEYVHIWYPTELFVGEDSLKLRTQSQRFYEDYIIRFVVTDTLTGCVAMDTVQVDLTGVFGTTPNAFSPNDDGINDIFMKDIDLIILNRLGMEIFRSKNKEGWDGTYKGKKVDKDDYLYIITVATKKKQYIKKGTVTVF